MARLHRLHLGAGDKYWPGWVNHDAEIDLKALPYEDGSVSDIQAMHLFEHLPRNDTEEYLREWYRVLCREGRLVMEMPSMDKIAQQIVDGETTPRLTLLGIFGDHRYRDELMMHHWCWQNWELEAVLVQAGFTVKFTNPVFHIERRDLRVEAIK